MHWLIDWLKRDLIERFMHTYSNSLIDCLIDWLHTRKKFPISISHNFLDDCTRMNCSGLKMGLINPLNSNFSVAYNYNPPIWTVFSSRPIYPAPEIIGTDKPAAIYGLFTLLSPCLCVKIGEKDRIHHMAPKRPRSGALLANHKYIQCVWKEGRKTPWKWDHPPTDRRLPSSFEEGKDNRSFNLSSGFPQAKS